MIENVLYYENEDDDKKKYCPDCLSDDVDITGNDAYCHPCGLCISANDLLSAYDARHEYNEDYF